MKKVLFLLLFGLLRHQSVLAQLHIGLKAGGIASTLHYKNQSGDQARVGFYGGIYGIGDLDEQFFFYTGGVYSLRGYSFSAIGNNSRGRVGYGYITCPLLGGYRVSKKFSLLLGPELGYMISARSHFNNATVNIYKLVSQKFNVDVSGGMSWQATKDLALEARFNWGLTGMYKGEGYDQYGNPTGTTMRDGFHRLLQVGIAYNVYGK